MAEELYISQGDKEERYKTLLPQLEALAQAETDTIANMANFAAAISATFGHWWVGFYRVLDEQLVLGPYQGPLACTRIPYGKGVCGTAWQQGSTVIVDDVDTFPGHIACSSLSRSEIVVPIWGDGKVTGVLDIDSTYLCAFDDTDRIWLEKIVVLL